MKLELSKINWQFINASRGGNNQQCKINGEVHTFDSCRPIYVPGDDEESVFDHEEAEKKLDAQYEKMKEK